MQEVFITIKGTQFLDGDSDVIEMASVGRMTTVGKTTYIRYDDSTSDEDGTVKCLIKYDRDDESVIMQRNGRFQSRMYIKMGQRHICHYDSVGGALVMGIFGEKVKGELDDNGGNVSFAYTIDVIHSMLSRNEVEITVKKS